MSSVLLTLLNVTMLLLSEIYLCIKHDYNRFVLNGSSSSSLVGTVLKYSLFFKEFTGNILIVGLCNESTRSPKHFMQHRSRQRFSRIDKIWEPTRNKPSNSLEVASLRAVLST